MSLSNSTLTPGNLLLSPMRVTFNGVDLGGTLGNVAISMAAMKAELKVDQLGETVVDRRVSGHKMTVTTELAEVNLKDNWKVVFPWMQEVTSGGNKMMYASSQMGRKDQDDAKILLLHPLDRADADLTGDFKFFKAVASGESETVYGPTGQVKMKLVWNILPDFATTPVRFLIHGDPSIGLVAATAGTPALTGTGNGTMTSVVAYSGFTQTETITATCVGAVTNGGKFEVVGSLSGPLGLATVGTPFVAFGSQISFTINDGTTDFVVGDVFTVATTAANYA